MEAPINIEMLVLAREARGLSQAQVAHEMGMSPTNYSKAERGEIGLSDSNLERMAQLTQMPLQFFARAGKAMPQNILYRKRQVVAQKLMAPIHAKANMIRLQAEQLVTLLGHDAYHPSHHQLSAQPTVHGLAEQCRAALGIPLGVVNNLTEKIEHWGMPIASFDFHTARVDSTSISMHNKLPIIITNKTLPGCRLRFSLAYELGYLLLTNGSYNGPMENLGHLANLFAAELLMPEAAIREDLDKGINIAALAQLKAKWKVSMIALLYRADDLGYTTPNQKRYLLQQFNALTIRRHEPPELDIPPEQPQMLRQWIATTKSQYRLGTVEMAALLCMNLPEYMDWYPSDK